LTLSSLWWKISFFLIRAEILIFAGVSVYCGMIDVRGHVSWVKLTKQLRNPKNTEGCM
jgi:hypothetical protein